MSSVTRPEYSMNAAVIRSRLVRSKKSRRLRAYAILLAGDLLSVFAAFMIANLARFGEVENSQGILLLSVVLPLFLILSGYSRSYGMNALIRPLWGMRRTVEAFLLSFGSVAFIVYFLQASESLSRLTFGIAMVIGTVLISLERYLLASWMLRQMGGSPLATVVIEDGMSCSTNLDDIVFNARDFRIDPATQDPKTLDRFALLVGQADRVVIACSAERYSDWQMMLKGLNVQSELLFTEVLHLTPVGIGSHDQKPTLVISEGPLDLRARLIKRIFDIVLAGPALLFLFPLFLALAVAIKLDSSGPAFFKQERIGRDNRLFHILKFRSMYHHHSDKGGVQSARRGDSRITRVGRFLRRTSMDELPQLLNVLFGHMSIVGPRPHALASTAEDKLFWEIDPRYWHRHAIKPGLTGLAQVRGFRGATEHESDLVDRLSSDLEYASGWTIWRDISIISSTFKVLIHRNAF